MKNNPNFNLEFGFFRKHLMIGLGALVVPGAVFGIHCSNTKTQTQTHTHTHTHTHTQLSLLFVSISHTKRQKDQAAWSH